MQQKVSWHHAPPHWIEEKGIYMVTGATLHKRHLFKDPESLTMLQSLFFELCSEFKWSPHAWSFFSNHYHFIGESPPEAETLRPMLSKLHMQSAKWANKRAGTQGRKVWYQFWDSRITWERSYWPRLRYVNENPVKHGLVSNAALYPWCSASWIENNARRSHLRKMLSFHTDKLKIFDDF
ncbi:MAG: transposase [Puniceicoccaceae bacterium]